MATTRISTLLQHATPAVPDNYRWLCEQGSTNSVTRIELQRRRFGIWRTVRSAATHTDNLTEYEVKRHALRLWDEEFNASVASGSGLYGVTRS
jgi:hypothetical protein